MASEENHIAEVTLRELGFAIDRAVKALHDADYPQIDEKAIRADERKKFAEWLAGTCSVWTEDYPFGMSCKTLIYEYEHQTEGGQM